MKRNKSDMDMQGECSMPKKSKSSKRPPQSRPQWAYLPSVVLHQIFDYLNQEDRKNASSVCSHWRTILFHPKWWPSMKFKIHHDNLDKARFYREKFGRIVTEATVSLYLLSPACINEFISLLLTLKKNNHLQRFLLEPSHCQLELLFQDESQANVLYDIINFLTGILPRLTHFSIGCVENLSNFTEYILEQLTPSKIALLGLASIKYDSVKYKSTSFDPALLSPFRQLRILSVDYDHLCDAFLYSLEGSNNLERLVVHVHSVSSDHCGTSNPAWKDFKRAHPKCFLRLSLIHAYDVVGELDFSILKEEMPLSHIKVLFCEDVNLEALHRLSAFYPNTLKSVVWIDSLSDSENSWKFPKADESPDPFVLMCWLCSNFEELVLIGYQYWEDNLIAIGRLRGPKMKKLEIPMSNVMFDGPKDSMDGIKDISKNLQRSWYPSWTDDLHPVILDPTAGDSDEFILPIVLADLQ